MKLLLDQNLSPKLIQLLSAAGHDVEHIGGHGMAAAADPDVLAFAAESGRTLVSADTDFGTLLARMHAGAPSFVFCVAPAGAGCLHLPHYSSLTCRSSSRTSQPAPSS